MAGALHKGGIDEDLCGGRGLFRGCAGSSAEARHGALRRCSPAHGGIKYKDIANDPEVQIVVETMGGVEPAYTFVKAMLEAGKHVTTSNKALVAEKGAELIALAKDNNVNFLFEASVGGGIPIIRPLNSCLTADEIEEITGILNGTTNYMMTKMSVEGSEFDDVLKDAHD